MIIARTINEIRKAVAEARRGGKRIGFVPTMGALHEGHLSLVRAAKADSDFVVVSIFVNPTQFGPNEDYQRYPRMEKADLEACRGAGVDAVFLPAVEEMYPAPPLTEVAVKGISLVLCGKSRPSHFAGVATVVAKLFNIIQPDRAFFGAKDFQQTVVIRRMAADLNFLVEIVVCPTVREADGLAMSSRNAYLSVEHRRAAMALSRSLLQAQDLIRCQHPPAEAVVTAIKNEIAKSAPDAVIDYVQVVDPATLQDVSTTNRPVLVALAVKFGATRLIDNVLVET